MQKDNPLGQDPRPDSLSCKSLSAIRLTGRPECRFHPQAAGNLQFPQELLCQHLPEEELSVLYPEISDFTGCVNLHTEQDSELRLTDRPECRFHPQAAGNLLFPQELLRRHTSSP